MDDQTTIWLANISIIIPTIHEIREVLQYTEKHDLHSSILQVTLVMNHEAYLNNFYKKYEPAVRAPIIELFSSVSVKNFTSRSMFSLKLKIEATLPQR